MTTVSPTLDTSNRLVHYACMPQVSRNKLHPKIEEGLIQTLHLILAQIDNLDLMGAFLSSFLTKTEQVMLAKRLTVVILVNEGKTDTEIASMLHTTRMTVAKLRYFFEARGEGYNVALKILSNEKLREQIKTLALDLTRYAIRAAGGRVKPTIF